MNEPYDPLEAELAALRPHDASPELRKRIADHLTNATRSRSRWRWSLAVGGGLAAACLAAIVFWLVGGRGVEPAPIAVQPQPMPPREFETSEPTLLAYQRALARSPEELNALLNMQAVAAPDSNPELARIVAFTRSESALRALLGED